MSERMIVERDRFLLNDPRRYLVQGTIPDKDCRITARLNGRRLPLNIYDREAYGASERAMRSERKGVRIVNMVILLPEKLPEKGSLVLSAFTEGKEKNLFQKSAAALRAAQGKPQYFIEEQKVDRRTGVLSVRGWVAADCRQRIRMYDEKKVPIQADIRRFHRADVSQYYYECAVPGECGFTAEVRGAKGSCVYLVAFTEKKQKLAIRIPLKEAEILLDKAKLYTEKGVRYFKNNGARVLVEKAGNTINRLRHPPVVYEEWLTKHLPTEMELERQRTTGFDYEPLFSVVVPLYRTEQKYLEELVDSVKAQTYPNWELCLSDGSGPDSPIRAFLETLPLEDERIRVIFHDEPLRIAENTNAAIDIAEGEFVVFADHDDALCPHALFECLKKINEEPRTDVLYSDEDKMSADGQHFFEPHFKPDFNQDLLCTVNYICHLLVVKKELLDKAGGLRPEYDGAQDYDLIFRCTEQAEKISHVPKILYHWRYHEGSTSENPESKKYAFEAGARAIKAHFDRIGIETEIYAGEFPGLYRTRYIRKYDPLISIIIPNKDHIDDLERCISSIEKKSTYRNYEYVIVENNSTESSTFDYYEKLKRRLPNVKVVVWKGPFNYSDINNFAVDYADGEYYLLLNNDTEVIAPEWMEELVGYCMRPDVGIVGARLYYEDDTIQHAGVVLGFLGLVGHCFVQQKREATGYCHRIICAQNYSAVTAACMLVKAKVFREVGGFSHDLAVAFNDVDFCLKVTHAGYLIVYDPYVELYHYESKSRGLEDTPEKQERFARETATLEKHWPGIFTEPDPYYNVNLTLKSQDFSLKRL